MKNLPNLVSLLRLVLVVPLVWAIVAEYRFLALLLGSFAIVTDALDGILARRLRLESELGRLLDPLADKVLAAAVAITLVAREQIPSWYAGTVIGRDILIIIGSIVLHAHVGMVTASLPIGKLAATSVGLVLLAAIAQVPFDVLSVMMFISTVLLTMSLLVYAARLVRFVRPNTR